MSQTDRRHLFTADARFAITETPKESPAQEAAEGEEQITLSGYAMTWGAISSDRGGYKVQLQPGSAKFATPTLALWQHDFRLLLGNTANGTLRITSDDIGVKIEVDLPDTTAGRDVAELVEDAYLTGCSFSMINNPVGKMTTIGAQKVFVVSSFDCDEVSIVSNPSFDDTSIDLKPAADPQPQPVSFSDRVAQSLQLERLRLQSLSL